MEVERLHESRLVAALHNATFAVVRGHEGGSWALAPWWEEQRERQGFDFHWEGLLLASRGSKP